MIVNLYCYLFTHMHIYCFLLQPFWPTGSGCARGFLSSFDACWMIRSFSSGKMMPLEVLAERESIYRLLAQTTPENLSKGKFLGLCVSKFPLGDSHVF